MIVIFMIAVITRKWRPERKEAKLGATLE